MELTLVNNVMLDLIKFFVVAFLIFNLGVVRDNPLLFSAKLTWKRYMYCTNSFHEWFQTLGSVTMTPEAVKSSGPCSKTLELRNHLIFSLQKNRGTALRGHSGTFLSS